MSVSEKFEKEYQSGSKDELFTELNNFVIQELIRINEFKGTFNIFENIHYGVTPLLIIANVIDRFVPLIHYHPEVQISGSQKTENVHGMKIIWIGYKNFLRNREKNQEKLEIDIEHFSKDVPK